MTMEPAKTKFLKKVHTIGTNSKAIIIHPNIVKQCGIDDMTFCEEEVTPDGILLRIRRLTA